MNDWLIGWLMEGWTFWFFWALWRSRENLVGIGWHKVRHCSASKGEGKVPMVVLVDCPVWSHSFSFLIGDVSTYTLYIMDRMICIMLLVLIVFVLVLLSFPLPRSMSKLVISLPTTNMVRCERYQWTSMLFVILACLCAFIPVCHVMPIHVNS